MDKHLKELEEKSISVIREAKARFKNVAMLWSMGKDSTVTLGLARKAFLGHIPFPVIHIDNGIDFPETYALRKKVSKDWGFEMVVEKSIVKQDKISGVDCCGGNKTDALKKVMDERKIDALIVSIRRDEHGIRAKERYFSPRDKEYKWDYKNQAPEIWDYLSDFPESDHVRIHPLLHWQEIDVWKYLKAEKLPVNPLYFSRNGLPAPRPTTYVIRCEDNSFYIGQTENMPKRWQEHKEGKATWTKEHKPTEVIHFEEFATRDEAVKREKELKTGFGRQWLKREYKKGALQKWYAPRQAGERFRSLGCTKCTVAMKSEAKTLDEIIAEIEKATDSERGGRAQDKEKEYVMQQLRALGYM